ncbi:MAG: response regulator [Saprospiraceae bacterium]|nr:response regulator [Saprospiraceae bacterium]
MCRLDCTLCPCGILLLRSACVALACFLWPNSALLAQAEPHHPLFAIRLFNARDGLPDNKVVHLLETRKSPFRWAVTTNELCRFDGYRFQTVWEKMPDNNGIAENARGEIVIWHYRSERILSVFDPVSGRKTTRTLEQFPQLKGELVAAWSQDTAIFLGIEAVPNTVFEVWRLFPDFTTQLLHRLHTSALLGDKLPSHRPKFDGYFDEKRAQLWLSANILGKPNEVQRVQLETGRTEAFALLETAAPLDVVVRMTNASGLPLRVCLGASNTLWTWNEQAQQFEKDTRYPGKLPGLVLIGEDQKGALIFRKQDQGANSFWLRRPDGTWLDLASMLPDLNYQFCVGSDFSRQIHFATMEGVLRVNFEKPLFRQFVPTKKDQLDFPNAAFRGIAADRLGNIWMAGEMIGLFRMRPDGSVERAIPVEKNTQKRFSTQNAVNLQVDAAGYLWAARNSIETPNLYRFDPTTGLADTFHLEKHSIASFLILKNGKILLAARDEKTARLVLFDPATRRFETCAEAGENEKFKTAPLFFLENEQGKIWVAGNEGLALFDPEKRHFLPFPGDTPTAHEYPIAVLFLQNETLWCGSLGGGLRKLDLQSGQWEVFTMANGLPANKIAGILPDDDQNLWISTWEGLSFLQPQAKLFTNFFVSNGLTHNEFNRFSFFRDTNSALFFGGLHGVNYFQPEEVLASFLQGYDSLLISQISWFAADGKTRQEQIFGLDGVVRITLPPDNRFCNIQLALANYLQPEANRFSWKLEGHDKDWRLSGTNNEITFHYLPAGKYRLRVRAANPTGIWSQNERVLLIEVREFWYKSVWFFVLLVLTMGLLLYVFYKNRVRHQLDLAENRRIREIEQLRSRLYTNITHEFRTPLTVILGISERLDEEGFRRSASELKNGLALIQRNGKNLLRLINQLLDLSKIESGAMQPHYVRADVIGYLQYLTESFYSMASEREIRLIFYPETPSLVVDFDEEKLQDIVYNLLSNALKFTSAGGKVVFHAKALHGEPGAMPAFLQLKIQDTGQGITPEQLPHIFDRFYQADNSNTRPGEGTGIGLALVKELVGLLGGAISVESEPGKGTVFTVLLPCAMRPTSDEVEIPDENKPIASPHEDKPYPAQARPEADLPVAATQPLFTATPLLPTVLVIEDNSDVVAYIAAILKSGYQIQTAANGREGMEIAFATVPDIIISDVMMPEKDGYEVCATLKNDERTSHIPIILLTAKAAQDDKVTGLRVGADAYLQKPFDKAELLVRMEKLIELRQKLQMRHNAQTVLSEQGAQRPEPTIDERFLQKIRQAIEDKINDPELGIVHLCRATHLSHTQVFRKMKALTGQNPTLYIRSLRLQRAMQLLKTTDLNVSEIAYEVGFSDPNYFSRSFSEEFGMPPSEARG